jgi:hypothetical protein
MKSEKARPPVVSLNEEQLLWLLDGLDLIPLSGMIDSCCPEGILTEART